MGKTKMQEATDKKLPNSEKENAKVIQPRESCFSHHNHNNLHVQWKEESIIHICATDFERSDDETDDGFRQRSNSEGSTMKKPRRKTTKTSKATSETKTKSKKKVAGHSESKTELTEDDADEKPIYRHRSYSDPYTPSQIVPKSILKHRQTCVVIVHDD